MNTARVSSTLHSAVNTQSQRLPVAGKIRAGIKVLTRKAQSVPGLLDAYKEGIAAGASFDDIERTLKQIKDCPAYPLTPKNSPFFRVSQSDFVVPGAAESIMDLYGEQRKGDSVPKLYSFPVVFPSDDIDLVFREQFEAWQRSELLRWSEQDPNTETLMCMKRADLKPDQSKRKRWGGRPIEQIRPCDPNDCDLFAAGTCQHNASLYFWIPGVPGIGLVELQFTSVYASRWIFKALNVVNTGLGHIKGLNNGLPIFSVSKVLQDISVIDWEKGKATRQQQYIIRLEAAGLDMVSAMLGTAERPPALPAPTTAEAEEPITEPDTHLTELRAEVLRLSDELGFEGNDLSDWIAANYENGGQTETDLADMIVKLSEMSETADEEPVITATGRTMTGSKTDSKSDMFDPF